MSSKADPVLCGKRGAEFGKLGSEFGKLGGRPRNRDQYGMPDTEYNEILAFLNSPLWTIGERAIIAIFFENTRLERTVFIKEIPTEILCCKVMHNSHRYFKRKKFSLVRCF